MTPYRRILAAIDLTEHSLAIAGRACTLAQPTGTVRLLHVVGYVAPDPLAVSIGEPPGGTLGPALQIDRQLERRAREQMAALTRQLALPDEAGVVEIGSVKSTILRCAREFGSDLIVLGSRERHGLAILIHRVEDSVLHRAACDVLAVHAEAANP